MPSHIRAVRAGSLSKSQEDARNIAEKLSESYLSKFSDLSELPPYRTMLKSDTSPIPVELRPWLAKLIPARFYKVAREAVQQRPLNEDEHKQRDLGRLRLSDRDDLTCAPMTRRKLQMSRNLVYQFLDHLAALPLHDFNALEVELGRLYDLAINFIKRVFFVQNPDGFDKELNKFIINELTPEPPALTLHLKKRAHPCRKATYWLMRLAVPLMFVIMGMFDLISLWGDWGNIQRNICFSLSVVLFTIAFFLQISAAQLRGFDHFDRLERMDRKWGLMAMQLTHAFRLALEHQTLPAVTLGQQALLSLNSPPVTPPLSPVSASINWYPPSPISVSRQLGAADNKPIKPTTHNIEKLDNPITLKYRVILASCTFLSFLPEITKHHDGMQLEEKPDEYPLPRQFGITTSSPNAAAQEKALRHCIELVRRYGELLDKVAEHSFDEQLPQLFSLYTEATDFMVHQWYTSATEHLFWTALYSLFLVERHLWEPVLNKHLLKLKPSTRGCSSRACSLYSMERRWLPLSMLLLSFTSALGFVVENQWNFAMFALCSGGVAVILQMLAAWIERRAHHVRFSRCKDFWARRRIRLIYALRVIILRVERNRAPDDNTVEEEVLLVQRVEREGRLQIQNHREDEQSDEDQDDKNQ